MKRRLLLAAVTGLVLALPFAGARADDRVDLERTSVLVGEHIEMHIQVLAPEGATVELTPGTPGWEGVELVSVDEVTQAPQADGVQWFIVAKIAAFEPGPLEFIPTLAIIEGSEATPKAITTVQLSVLNSLAPEAELVLSPLDRPTEIPGAESPLLKPAVVAGSLLGAVVLALILFFAGRALLGRLRKVEPMAPEEMLPPDLRGAEQLIHSDPVNAYRLMSSVVKNELARRYGVRATALTTTELRRRLETDGDRWEARLVGGLLEECDSVIYAGYRPAAERREHDLTMAREIVEAPA